MILDTRTGELTEGTFFRKTYWLTLMHTKILEILSDNDAHTNTELCEKLNVTPVCLRNHLHTLRKRVKGIQIQTYRGFGVKLIDTIILK